MKTRQVVILSCMMLGLLASNCDLLESPSPQVPKSGATVSPGAQSLVLATQVAPTSTVQPTVATTSASTPTNNALPPEPSAPLLLTATSTPLSEPIVAVQREGDGFRIEASSPTISESLHLAGWIDSSRLVVTTIHEGQYGLYADATYLADLATASARRLEVDGTGWIIPGLNKQEALLVQGEDHTPFSVALLDVASGQIQTILSEESGQPQWLTSAKRDSVLRNVIGLESATWLDENLVVLKLTLKLVLEGNAGYATPGRLLLLQLHAPKFRVLADEGELAAVLPNGRLLIRPGWVDGPLEVLVPHYDGQPIQITPGGPWTETWAVSPNGKLVAWFEMDDPWPGHRNYLPDWLDSSGPFPMVRSIVIWDRGKGQIRRFPMKVIFWPDIQLHWRKDNSAVVYSGYPPGKSKQLALYQMKPNGQTTELAHYDGDGLIRVLADGIDGSLYFMVGPKSRGNNYWDRPVETQFARMHPDGKLEVLSTQVSGFNNRYLDEPGLLISPETDTSALVTNLATGNTSRFSNSAGVHFSPDGQWIVDIGWNAPLRIIPVKPNPP